MTSTAPNPSAPQSTPVVPDPIPGWDTDGTTVILVAIEHRHGTNYSAHRTLAGAEAEVYHHVFTWWEDEVQGRWANETDPAPAFDALTRADAIAIYFEAVEDEHYAILNDVPFTD